MSKTFSWAFYGPGIEPKKYHFDDKLLFIKKNRETRTILFFDCFPLLHLENKSESSGFQNSRQNLIVKGHKMSQILEIIYTFYDFQ